MGAQEETEAWELGRRGDFDLPAPSPLGHPRPF